MERFTPTLSHGLYVVTGIMASGKSTIAQMLAEQAEKSVHVRGDSFRRMIVQGREDMQVNPGEEALSQLRLRYRLAARVADDYYDAGFTVVLQDNYIGHEINTLLDEIKSIPLYLITLNPSREAVMEREWQRAKKGYTSYNVAGLYETLQIENPQIGLWVDSTRQRPEETTAEILRRVANEGRIR